MELPPDVSEIVDEVVAGAKDALGDDLLGVYLRGSLALGGFDPGMSDIDLLIVTSERVSGAEFESLRAMHEHLAALPNRYAHRIEASYIDGGSLRRFGPEERRHPSIGSDWPFQWGNHRDNWVLERWTVRERDSAVLGLDPKMLIDPISPDELCAAVRSELRVRVEHWAGQPGEPEWLLPRYYQAFEIETVCRALYTLALGVLPSKPQAVAWALEALPKRRRPLIEWSREHHADFEWDASRIPEVKAFTCWAASKTDPGLKGI